MSAAIAIWHDVECGSYAADLPVWEEMAASAAGPILDLGCGTGRVALHLARRGHPVVGIDIESELIATLAERAEDHPLEAIVGDARDFRLEEVFALALAPMQTLQLLADRADRIACLRRVADHLQPGGRFAAAIIEQLPAPDDSPPPLPDVREVDGWVYSSLTVEAVIWPGEILIRRLRQTVSPDGELAEEENEVRIATFPAAQLEAEGAVAGLVALARHEIPPTDIHVGSTVVVLGREA